MQRYFSFRVKVAVVFLSLMALFGISATSSSVLNSYSPALRRYPYLTDAVGPYATLNWATDRSESSGAVRFGKVGSEACTTHYVPATKTPISVNGVLQYQWKAQLNLVPGTQYCYRVYLGTSPVNQIDLLGSDAAPSFWTQVPMGAPQSYSFDVIGDWGMVDSTGTNSYQASLMSLIASSGARFVVTTGDNGYPDGNQKNLGDLIQIGQDISAVFGPSFWKVPGSSLPIFPILGNHGFSSPDINHPALLTWPQDKAVTTSGGRYIKETYCCLDGTTSAVYPSAWYAFDAGPARFYILNAAWDEINIGTASEYQVDFDYHWAPGTPQYEWLKADLAAHPSVLKFAFWHYPVYSDNPIESTDTFLQGNNSLEGLLKQNGVDLGFTGHAHIYERNLASASGIPNYITGGGGATLGTLGTCTSLDAYAIKFTTTGKACGSAPVPTSQAQVFHFLKVTVNGTNVTVTPINSLGQTFDIVNYAFTSGAESTAPTTPTDLVATVVSGTQINLSWSASTDNTSVRGYGIYRNGVLVNTVDKNTLSYSDSNLNPATTYVYRVDAFDGSGNHSALSTSKSPITQSAATYTFNPVADAYVAGDFATTNYGTSAMLKADTSPSFESFLRFNIGDVSGTVTKATLRLYTTSSSATGYQVKRVTDQMWEEGTITDTNAPSVGSIIGSSGNFAAGNWTSVDVTSFITGNGIYDLALTTTSTVTLNFNSRDASQNQPQFVIETKVETPDFIFADVPVGYWAKQYIETLYAVGITGGCGVSPLNYCPTAHVTRAQMAVFLLRAKHGSNYSPPAASGVLFQDVPSSYWAAAWIEELAAEGITQGCGSDNYCPETVVTRDQMAVFLLRTKHGSSYAPPVASGTLFADVPVSYWAAAWIEQLVVEGITAGCGSGDYCPTQSVARDQMAVFLVRTFNLP
jgi:calcineurin-like phosphoesterase family protein/fibronectin type III domain protein/S-layer family protein